MAVSETAGEISVEGLEGSNVPPDPPEDEAGVDEPPPKAAPTRALAGTPTGKPAGLSDRGAQFIARFEGCVLHLYNDPAGHCTIGIGHLVHFGNCNGSEPAEFKQGISMPRAYQLLEQDARDVASAVQRFVRVPLNQPQFDALCSFGFNCGVGAIQSSGVTRTLNAGNSGGVPAQLMKWVNSGGHPFPGLVRRRRAEGELFAHGNYAA